MKKGICKKCKNLKQCFFPSNSGIEYRSMCCYHQDYVVDVNILENELSECLNFEEVEDTERNIELEMVDLQKLFLQIKMIRDGAETLSE